MKFPIERAHEIWHRRVEPFLVETPSGCWEWIKASDKQRYPQVQNRFGNITIHKLSFIVHKGLVPEDHYVCYECDNTKCCNPDHLFSSTPQGNMDDKVSKHRQAKGEDFPFSNLTREKVLIIRERSALGVSPRQIASSLQINALQVRRVLRGTTWSHVEAEG